MQIVIAVALTLLIVFIAVNVGGGETKIERRIARIFGLDDSCRSDFPEASSACRRS